MKRRNEILIIIVSDKGAGFDPKGLWQKNRPSDGGYGLFNIRERLLLLGGDFQIESSPSSGTKVTLAAPLQGYALETIEPGIKTADAQPHESTHRKLPEPSGGSIKVMLVDDHAVMRQGLSLLLSRHTDIEIVGEAADGAQAVEMARRINPDIILMDISMPVMDGIEATRIIRSHLPQIRIITLSMHEAEDQASAAKRAGAVAYLSKSGNPDAILSTIRQFGSGGQS
jgi:CheY-like chemotaxis protein